MTDEISWKQKCKRVAEWLGEVRGYKGWYGGSARVFNGSDEDGIGAEWLDYTSDDIAAWRLQRVLLREFYIEIGDGYVVDAADVTPLDTSPTVIAQHDDFNKALVLAACKLIDEGRELQK